MYERLPESDEPDAFGLSRKDYAHDVFDLWPENLQAYQLFSEIQTQWRMSMSGPTGLDYNVLFSKMARMRLDPEQFDALEEDIRTMEFSALAAMNEKPE